MMTRKSWKWFSRSRSGIPDGGTHQFRMKVLPFMGIVCTTMLFVVYRTNNYQHQHRQMEDESYQFGKAKEPYEASRRVSHLPRGIVHSRSDLEMRPLWLTTRSSLKAYAPSQRNLLAIAAGVKQRKNVDAIVQKFLPENFTIILFHYDCNVNGWRDLEWSSEAIHIVAHNQTKWWFAKRFLHPDVVSIYDYIFIWDEDLGVNDFHPGKYLKIMKSEGLEISQPALDPDSAEIHHRITIRKKRKKLHRRIYEHRGSFNCSGASRGPPCTGWVEGMAPVFSRAAWFCVWHLIQNDLVHGWGMDMKLGYCAQGDRTKKVGIIDSEYIVHQGVQTLGSSSDPYHGPGQAMGLSFSVPKGIKIPSSLGNIFKELKVDLGCSTPSHGDLERWALQGVLLLNTVLTVRSHQANSHANKGWETFTDSVIQAISLRKSGVVFLLWGNSAQAKSRFIDESKHHILKAAHPSGLSANRGFFGCRHFSQTNQLLERQGLRPIDWQI